MSVKKTSMLLLIIFVISLTLNNIAFALTKENGKVILTEEEFVKLDEYIKKLEKQNELLKAENELLNKKIKVLEEKVKAAEEFGKKTEEICNDKTNNLQEQLKELEKKINLQQEMILNKDVIIKIKEEQISEAKKRTLLYSVLGLMLGYILNDFIQK